MDCLHRLLAHAVATVPFYAERGAYGEVASATGLTVEAWSGLPVLSRANVQEAGRALRSQAVPGDHGPLFETVTSGSTGRPVHALGTLVTGALWQAITLRDLVWHPRDITGKLAAIRSDDSDGIPPEGLDVSGWAEAIDLVYDSGPCALFSVRQDVALQADWLVGHQPDYLLSYPSNLRALARYFQAKKMKLTTLRGVTSYGEALAPEVRDECRSAWGTEIVDMYSSQEIGYIALQCPESESYHVQSEAVYVEVLDDDGRRCQTGEVGRVVVSALHNFAMPLLRYELGDYAEVGGPCPCGRGLPVLTRVLGRQRNMLLSPDGTKTWPTFPAQSWARIGPIRQLQLAQLSLDHIEARIVGPRPLTDDEMAEFTAVMHLRFAHPFRVSFDYRDQIDRTGAGKFEDFVSLVGGGG
ncbi:MAG TPA: AMP-binding protein [Acidimicrobiales bacterium]